MLKVDVTKDDDFHSKKAGILGVYIGMPPKDAKKTLEKNKRFVVEDKKEKYGHVFRNITVFAEEDGEKGKQLIQIRYNPGNDPPKVLNIEISFEFVPLEFYFDITSKQIERLGKAVVADKPPADE